MIDIDFYTPLLFIGAFVTLITLLIPALVLPWRAFPLYFTCGFLGLLVTWYASNVPSFWVIFFSFIGYVAFAIGLIVRVLRVPSGTLSRPRPLRVAFLLTITPALVVVTIGVFISLYEERKLPDSFIGSNAIYLPRALGTPCEISVWDYSELKDKQQVRIEQEHLNWKLSPISESSIETQQRDHWLNGIGCSNIDSVTKDSIIQALLTTGSKYYPGINNGYVLLPARKFLIHVYVY